MGGNVFCPEKEDFFEDMTQQHLALTFDDVILQTGRSHFSARRVDINSYFSRNIELKVPIVSAAMDTVTDAEMAIAMAKLGGLGVVHAGFSVKAQGEEVRRVKHALNGKIAEPIIFREDDTLKGILNKCMKKKWPFRTFPIINNNGKLTGLLTGKDFEFPDDLSMTALEAMKPLREVVWAKANTDIDEAYRLMQEEKTTTLPLRGRRGEVAGLYVWSDVRDIVRGHTAMYNTDERNRLRVGAAVPTDRSALKRVDNMREYVDVVVIDSSQGDSDYGVKTLKALKSDFPDIDVVAGNITSGESAVELAFHGADGIKVGQGGGSICTTRAETGSGRPQVTAVWDCAKTLADYGFDIPVCSDGGIAYRGGVPIAIAAGASSVMMGMMLAGTHEAAGPVYEDSNGQKWKLYRGMGSISSLRSSASARRRYSADDIGKLLAEGIEAAVPIKGSVEDEMTLLSQALRRGLSLARSKNIEDHRRNATFDWVTQAGAKEGHPHDVTVINFSEIAALKKAV